MLLPGANGKSHLVLVTCNYFLGTLTVVLNCLRQGCIMSQKSVRDQITHIHKSKIAATKKTKHMLQVTIMVSFYN